MTGLTPCKNKRACAVKNIDGYQRQEVTVRMLPKLIGMFFGKRKGGKRGDLVTKGLIRAVRYR